MRRRLPRILLNATTVLSLALCVATAAVWARSCVAPLWHARFDDSGYGLGLMVRQGVIDLCNSRDFSRDLSTNPDRFWDLFNYDARFGVRWASGQIQEAWDTTGLLTSPPTGKPPRATFWALRIPLWPACLLTGLLPATRLAYHCARRCLRRPPGLCPSCGYDLRATPARCPECSAVPPAPSL